jgi:hypothetical protein
VVTEELTQGYETHWETASASGTGRTATVPELTEPGKIRYTNTCDVLINTGVSLDMMPYILMAAGGLLLPGQGRRRKYDRAKNRRG